MTGDAGRAPGARLVAFAVASVGVWPTLLAFLLAVFGGWSVATSAEFALTGIAGAGLVANLGRFALDLPFRGVDRVATAMSCAWLAFAFVGFFVFDWVMRDFNGGSV